VASGRDSGILNVGYGTGKTGRNRWCACERGVGGGGGGVNGGARSCSLRRLTSGFMYTRAHAHAHAHSHTYTYTLTDTNARARTHPRARTYERVRTHTRTAPTLSSGLATFSVSEAPLRILPCCVCPCQQRDILCIRLLSVIGGRGRRVRRGLRAR